MRSYSFSVFQRLSISHSSEHEKNMYQTNGQVPKYSFAFSLLDLNARHSYWGETQLLFYYSVFVCLKQCHQNVFCLYVQILSIWHRVIRCIDNSLNACRFSLPISYNFEASTFFFKLLRRVSIVFYTFQPSPHRILRNGLVQSTTPVRWRHQCWAFRHFRVHTPASCHPRWQNIPRTPWTVKYPYQRPCFNCSCGPTTYLIMNLKRQVCARVSWGCWVVSTCLSWDLSQGKRELLNEFLRILDRKSDLLLIFMCHELDHISHHINQHHPDTNSVRTLWK